MAYEILIQPLSIPDLPAVADVHAAAFPESALTALGRGAVTRYYKWQLTGPHDALCIAAKRDVHLVGFCFAGTFRGALSGFIRQNQKFLILLTITRPWLLANPLFRERLTLGSNILLRLFRREHDRIASPEKTVRKPSFGVLAIAVHPNSQGHGVGRLLMEKVEEAALARGFEEINLTVHPENRPAIQFYERLGWEKRRVNGTWSGQMRKRLKAE